MIRARAILSLIAISALAGCGTETYDGPPKIRYGDSICVECGMIISDERFATATIVVGDRGNEPLVFDDFNCQFIFESKHSEFEIVDRWSHDQGSTEWIRMADAWYIYADELRTPMASNIASFQTQEQAELFAEKFGCDVLDYDSMRASNEAHTR